MKTLLCNYFKKNFCVESPDPNGFDHSNEFIKKIEKFSSRK